MQIAIGSDHAGYPLKAHLVAYLAAQGHEVLDLGTDSTEPVDYPAFCAAVGRAVVAGEVERGIVVGEGLAEAIVDIWLATPFDGGRHEARIDQITELETGDGGHGAAHR